MPSPIAHIGTGYILYYYSRHKLMPIQPRFGRLPVQLLLAVGLSILPDLDILLVLAFQDMEKYHNNFSHSLILGLFIALACAGVFYWLNRSRFWIWFLVSLLSYELHVIMDFFTGERGVMLFWPLMQDRIASPLKLFIGVQWGLGWFTIWHLWTFLTEILFIVALMTATHWVVSGRLWFLKNPIKKENKAGNH